ncbi:MAG TPA: hypothetical protein VHS96_01025 [Bacteroidia bacterium]|nr:hypothetical protein [Bacteroidia bacterium]
MMSRTITLLGLFLFMTLTTAHAQTNEFPWQVGRKATVTGLAAASPFNIVRIAAPGHTDGPATVLLIDQKSAVRAGVHAFCHNGEIVLSLPTSLPNGVYLYRLSTSARVEGKIVVQH